MKIPFYQSYWFGFSLEECAKNVKHVFSEVAESRIYDRIYDTLYEKKYAPLTEEWIQNKHNLSLWIERFLQQNNLAKSSMLSVGCGLGIVEQPLIKKGLSIDLQECQEKSVLYLQEKYPDTYEKTHFIYSKDLSNVDDATYDVVLAITTTYCLTDDVLDNFMKAVARILKPNGVFLFYETVLTWQDIRHYIKKKMLFRKEEGILWGWKRSQKHILHHAQRHQLTLKESYFFNKNNHEMTPDSLLNLPYDGKTSWNMMVLKKI